MEFLRERIDEPVPRSTCEQARKNGANYFYRNVIEDFPSLHISRVGGVEDLALRHFKNCGQQLCRDGRDMIPLLQSAWVAQSPEWPIESFLVSEGLRRRVEEWMEQIREAIKNDSIS